MGHRESVGENYYMCEQERLIHFSRSHCQGPNQVEIFISEFDTGRYVLECPFFNDEGNCTLMERKTPNSRCIMLGKNVQKIETSFRTLEPLPIESKNQ